MILFFRKKNKLLSLCRLSSKEYIGVVLALLKRKKCKGDHLFDKQSFKSRSFRHFYQEIGWKTTIEYVYDFSFSFVFLVCLECDQPMSRKLL